MRIAEIYSGIEGEGSRIGTPQTFIRTQGCRIGCAWCDTRFATTRGENDGKEMSIDEIVAEVTKLGIQNVSITGGNPVEQEDIVELVRTLKKKNFHISIEATGQDFNRELFDIVDFISCDIKPPSSKVKADIQNVIKIFERYDSYSHFKVVVADKKDLDFVEETYKTMIKSKHKVLKMIITPCWTEKQKEFNKKLFEDIQKRIIEKNLDIRVILQQHKVIWGAETKGV